MLGAGEEREEREEREESHETLRGYTRHYTVHYKVISIIFHHLTLQTLLYNILSATVS